MKNLKTNKLSREELKFILGGNEQSSTLDGNPAASCVADCGSGKAVAVCQGDSCWATDGVGCGSTAGVTDVSC